jgi:hypothetical protein
MEPFLSVISIGLHGLRKTLANPKAGIFSPIGKLILYSWSLPMSTPTPFGRYWGDSTQY